MARPVIGFSNVVKGIAEARAELDKMPPAASYQTAKALAIASVITKLYIQMTDTLLALNPPGANQDYSTMMSGVLSAMQKKWDAIDRYYVNLLMANYKADPVIPMTDFRDGGFKGNQLARISAVEDIAKTGEAAEEMLEKWGIDWNTLATAQDGLYDAANAANQTLAIVASSLYDITKKIAAAPGGILGSALGALPWGYIVGGVVVIGGGWFMFNALGSGAGRKIGKRI